MTDETGDKTEVIRQSFSGVTNAEARRLFARQHPGVKASYARRSKYGDPRSDVVVTGILPVTTPVERRKISRKPEDVDLRETEGWCGKYYDGNRYRDEAEARKGRWYVIVADKKDFETGEELDVIARDRREASLVGRAALARDYQDGMHIRTITLA